MYKQGILPATACQWAVRSLAVCSLLVGAHSLGEVVPTRGSVDSRVREAAYNGDQVYKLRGFVGYQIDLEFESGETFTGLGAGDLEGLSFVGQDNHLFLKPKAAKVATNLTVLTNRRQYQFDYIALAQRSTSDDQNVIYALRFTYAPAAAQAAAEAAAKRLDSELGSASTKRPQNTDYWYCGEHALRPVAAGDDGVHTRLRFSANADLPAIFVRNDDGSESLLNFSMEGGDVIIHRVAKRFILRRGRLTGCVVNHGFAGGGLRLNSGTVAPDVERRVQGVTP
ncbi:MAG: TrbG/VirB9 family P-type conjugative transfer protein [Pseudomonadota bacterium]|nr:TrbG/VirB9 family P-type conjugative transfer protein [Pseudomonadota bacterium]